MKLCQHSKWLPEKSTWEYCDSESIAGADFCRTHFMDAQGCVIQGCGEDPHTFSPGLCEYHFFAYIAAGHPDPMGSWMMYHATVEGLLQQLLGDNKKDIQARMAEYPINRLWHLVHAVGNEDGYMLPLPEIHFFHREENLNQPHLCFRWRSTLHMLEIVFIGNEVYTWQMLERRTDIMTVPIQEGRVEKGQISVPLLGALRGFMHPGKHFHNPRQ